MKKLLLILLSFGLVFNCYSADQWLKAQPAGTASPSDIDTLIGVNNEALDRLSKYYRGRAGIVYATASTLTMQAGSVACSNSDNSVRKWRTNTSTTTITWGHLDTGSEEDQTWYYVYAIADTDIATFTPMLSKSATAPTGATYYQRIGSFYNGTADDFGAIAPLWVSSDYPLPAFYEVAVSTGTIAHGGVIPLPSGYAQADCGWMVSTNDTSTLLGVNATTGNHARIYCSASASRVVTSQVLNPNTGSTSSVTANYIIVGVMISLRALPSN